jgi:hypothetical protein
MSCGELLKGTITGRYLKCQCGAQYEIVPSSWMGEDKRKVIIQMITRGQ